MPRLESATVNDAATRAEFRFDAIGAPWTIETAEPLRDHQRVAVLDRIDEFDLAWSRFRPDSVVSRMAARPGVWRFPDDAPPLFDLYRTLHERTGGRVSPLVGHRLEQLGYDAAYSFVPTTPLDPETGAVPQWDDRVRIDGATVTTSIPVLLDVGAAGKGYLVDLVAEVLIDLGVDEFVVDASGDLVHRGPRPIRVALEHPHDATMAVGVVELQNGAICASSSNRRAWGPGLHHIIDATTGTPTTAVVATWAITRLGREADGLATALFFADHDSLAVDFEFQSLRILGSGRLETSASFTGEVFS